MNPYINIAIAQQPNGMLNNKSQHDIFFYHFSVLNPSWWVYSSKSWCNNFEFWRKFKEFESYTGYDSLSKHNALF